MLSLSPSTLAWTATPVFIFGHSGHLTPVAALCGMCARGLPQFFSLFGTMKVIYSKSEGLKGECASEALEKLVKTDYWAPTPEFLT